MIESVTTCDMCPAKKVACDTGWFRVTSTEFSYTIALWQTMPQPNEKHICSSACVTVFARQWGGKQ